MRVLTEARVPVTAVEDYTGFPEMMNGRVKTLHPKIHGGLLALRDDDDHMAQARANDVEMIDLVVVNLYPFEQTIAEEGVILEEAVEQIDIGGPSMVRSASKNFRDVTIVTSPESYETVLAEMGFRDDLPLRRGDLGIPAQTVHRRGPVPHRHRAEIPQAPRAALRRKPASERRALSGPERRRAGRGGRGSTSRQSPLVQ